MLIVALCSARNPVNGAFVLVTKDVTYAKDSTTVYVNYAGHDWYEVDTSAGGHPGLAALKKKPDQCSDTYF